MPKDHVVIKYKCIYCGTIYDDKLKCVMHEPHCESNPDTKSCPTCVSSTTHISGKLGFGEHCSIRHHRSFAVHCLCSEWEEDK
jgi:hypothetical protein